MKNDTIKKILLYLVIAFVVVSIWRNPEGSASAAGDFLGSVGTFFSELIDRTATFVKGLTE
ncbi:MAG: hypothetical protein AB7Q42_07065 [Acidimicrobiia bacterium]